MFTARIGWLDQKVCFCSLVYFYLFWCGYQDSQSFTWDTPSVSVWWLCNMSWQWVSGLSHYVQKHWETHSKHPLPADLVEGSFSCNWCNLHKLFKLSLHVWNSSFIIRPSGVISTLLLRSDMPYKHGELVYFIKWF